MDKPFITYVDTKRLKIEFDKHPSPETLKYLPGMTDEQIEKIDEKPYVHRESLIVRITYKSYIWSFLIGSNYRWNGANIPPFAWVIIGSPDDPKFRLASMIHDWVCEHHKDIKHDRYLSTLMLVSLLDLTRLKKYKQWLVFHAVDNFQKLFCNW